MITRTTPVDQWPQLLRAEEAAAVLDISRGLIFELVRRGELPAVRLGRLIRIPRSAIAERIGAQVD